MERRKAFEVDKFRRKYRRAGAGLGGEILDRRIRPAGRYRGVARNEIRFVEADFQVVRADVQATTSGLHDGRIEREYAADVDTTVADEFDDAFH